LTLPLASLIVVVVVGFADGIPMPVQMLAISLMFGISAFVFFLFDRISASSEARTQARLREREKEYYQPSAR